MNAKCHNNSQAEIVSWIFMCINCLDLILRTFEYENDMGNSWVGANKVQSNFDAATE